MVTQRSALAAVAAVAALSVFALLGRWEEGRAAAATERGMRDLLVRVPDGWSHGLGGYRRTPELNCLLYRSGDDPFALEFCFDPIGRLVEAIDRTGDDVEIWSIREDPAASGIAVSVEDLVRAFRAAGTFHDVPLTAPSLPVGATDNGPTMIDG